MSDRRQLVILCCAFTCLGLILSSDIAAIVIGSQNHSVFIFIFVIFVFTVTHTHWFNVFLQQCSEEFVRDLTMDPHEYLLYGGIISLCVVFLETCVQIGAQVTGSNQFIATFTNICNCGFGLFILSWAIVGFVLYAELPLDCQTSPVGEIIVVWDVIKLLFASATPCLLCLQFFLGDRSTEQQYKWRDER